MARKKSVKKSEPTELTNAPATMKPQIVIFELTGMSPLLQNNPVTFIGVSESDELIAGKKKYNDNDEAKRRCYLDPDGRYCHPSEAIIKAITRAVTGKKFGKLTAATAVRGSVFIVEPFASIEDMRGKPATKYTIDKRAVVIGKARIPRCRPCWAKWQMRVPLEIDTSILTPAHILESLSLAGRIIGIGDYRPEKGGGFGRFTARIRK